jgi:D-erythronate 2-dehydrogenase
LISYASTFGGIMRILVIGGGGMLGHKLITRLAHENKLGSSAIGKILRHDIVVPPPPPNSTFDIETHVSDLSNMGASEKLIAERPDVIFHLAAIVSGEAETNFEKGYRINLDATRYLLDAIRVQKDYRPKLIFTSSIAVFGAPFPEAIDDAYFTTPLTSYGTQKAISELLIADYTRKGFIDGVSLRMPTICVRPGKANLAASSFFSNIIREPLSGKEAILPVSDQVRHWHISPRSAAGLLIHAATLDTNRLGNRRTLNMPGLSCTVAEQISALREIAGSRIANLIRSEPNPAIDKIVSGWPRNFITSRATELGFVAEHTFADIIRVHIEDELGGKSPT